VLAGLAVFSPPQEHLRIIVAWSWDVAENTYLLSPRMMTLSRTFLRDDMAVLLLGLCVYRRDLKTERRRPGEGEERVSWTAEEGEDKEEDKRSGKNNAISLSSSPFCKHMYGFLFRSNTLFTFQHTRSDVLRGECHGRK
jgi:hypothetical protein